MKEIYKDIYKKVKEFDKIVIARHIGADPDALGSSLGLKELILNTFPEKKVFSVSSASGGRKAGVPEFEDLIVSSSPLNIVETPKSVIFTLSFESKSKFSGFISR